MGTPPRNRNPDNETSSFSAKDDISAYLTRLFDTKPTIQGLNCPEGGISTKDAEFFAPWRLVAAFADGSRLLFDGLTEEQAREAMEAAQEQHGDIGYWNRVTDQNYEDGRYYKTIPEPPCVNVVDFTGYDGPLDENGFPVGLMDEIAQNAKEEGRDPNEPQIIFKRNAPPDDQPPHEK